MCRVHDWTNISYDIWEESKIDEYPSWRVRPSDIRYILLLLVRIPKNIYKRPYISWKVHLLHPNPKKIHLMASPYPLLPLPYHSMFPHIDIHINPLSLLYCPILSLSRFKNFLLISLETPFHFPTPLPRLQHICMKPILPSLSSYQCLSILTTLNNHGVTMQSKTSSSTSGHYNRILNASSYYISSYSLQ